MNPVEIIRKKRDGESLSQEEISFFVKSFSSGRIPDYQMSAFLMAVVLKGMNPHEVFYLTDSMMHTGKVLEFKDIKSYKVDKHSTGGVGDKVSIILAPLVAACSLMVPMISGRGLGHTGGTLDKLESIPGFRTTLQTADFERNLKRSGLSIISQSKDLIPADKKMYALRDVTATVESIPLITASILSKKLAEGIDGLVMDVKVGQGALMKTLADARELARSLKEAMKIFKKKIVCLITGMDQPLGFSIGNSLEIRECIEVLKGGGPEDLIELTLELASHMLILADEKKSKEKAKELLRQKLADGSALEKFREMLINQGGDPKIIEDPSLMGESRFKVCLKAPKSGYLNAIHSDRLGMCLVNLGAGRLKVTDSIDHRAGAVLNVKVGRKISKGQVLATIHYDKKNIFEEQRELLEACFVIKGSKPRRKPLIVDII